MGDSQNSGFYSVVTATEWTSNVRYQAVRRRDFVSETSETTFVGFASGALVATLGLMATTRFIAWSRGTHLSLVHRG